MDRADRGIGIDDVRVTPCDIGKILFMRDDIVIAAAILRHLNTEAERERIDHGGAHAARGNTPCHDHGVDPFAGEDRRGWRAEKQRRRGFAEHDIGGFRLDPRIEQRLFRPLLKIENRADFPQRRAFAAVKGNHAGDDRNAGRFGSPHHANR